MARYRFSIKHRGRLSATAPVARHVAYIMRDATYGPAQAHLQYLLRERATTRSREDLVHTEAHNLPAWAGGNPATFFAAAETYERVNGRVGTTWEIMLPRELPRAQQIAAVRDFLHTQFGDRHPYAWALHDSPASDGQTNPHGHVLFSTRTPDGIERSAAQFFRRYNPTHPAQGGARKERFFVEPRALVAQRQAWADVANWHLERAGGTARIDPRTLLDQGMDRAPERRLAPYHSTQAKYQGTLTPAWRATLEARADREAARTHEEGRAFAYWEARKVTLGLAAEPQMGREAFLTRVAEQTRALQPRLPRLSLEALRRQEEALVVAVQRQQQYVHRLHAEVMQEAHHERMGTVRSARAEARLAALLAEGAPGHPSQAAAHARPLALRSVALAAGVDSLATEEGLARGATFRFRDRDRGTDVGF